MSDEKSFFKKMKWQKVRCTKCRQETYHYIGVIGKGRQIERCPVCGTKRIRTNGRVKKL